MKTLLAACTALLGALAIAPVMAHHSFASEYDRTKPVSVTGVVRKVEWRNPHTFFYVDVEGESGKMQNWAMALGSPNELARRGSRQ